MKCLSAITALPLIFSSLTAAHPTEQQLEKRTNLVITTGNSGSNVYPRLEVREMLNKQPNQWTLLLLALQQWEAQSQSASTPATYFGIASIHGEPSGDYNGVQQCSACSGAWGFCTHSNVLFPAWHRTYMALFEQEFMGIVDQVVNQFSGSRLTAMQQAAATMRFPYWDWAANPPAGLPVVPEVVTDKYITVNGPKGTQTILNPLFRTTIDDPSSMYFADFNSYPVTYRYPTASGATAASQENEFVATFAQQRANLASSVYQLMTACTEYGVISNVNGGSEQGCTVSLEGIHNNVHVYIGGSANSSAGTYGGNMANLPVASFDPAFWLHHAMVDRLFAMWQTLHPDSYGATQLVQSTGGTWTVAVGSTQGPDSPLTPFYKDSNGNFWTTNEVENWSETFKYTYPEFVDSDGSASAIASYVNELYGPGATATAGSTKRTAAPEPVAVAAPEVTEGPISSLVDGIGSAISDALSTSSYQYFANIKAPHGVINGSYIVYVFHSQPTTENPDLWHSDPNLAGDMAMLMGGNTHTSGNLSSANLATGNVPLTNSLTSIKGLGLLTSLEQAVVIPYLQANMQWRVTGSKGQAIEPSAIPGLTVGVSSYTLSAISNKGELPTVSDFTLFPEVTQNKAGGLNTTEGWAVSTVGEVLGLLHL